MRNFLKRFAKRLHLLLPLAGLLVTHQSQALPVSVVLLYNDAPFKGAWVSTPLTSSDGFLTVTAWADANATVPANLYQWWYGLGVDSGTGNGALIDGQESMTLQFHTSVGCSRISFNYGGDKMAPTMPQQIAISGFLSDPGAYEIADKAPYISNLNYTNGTLTFDYLWDTGWNVGRLFFANPNASAGQTLRIKYNGAEHLGDSGVMVNAVAAVEANGGSQLQPVNVKFNAQRTCTSGNGKLTVRGYSDQSAQTPANFGTYLDECFGVYGGNNGAIDGNESVTMQFVSGVGLARLECVYASGQVTISGFLSDPGFTDPGLGAFGMTYSDGVLSFYPMDGGRHVFFFTNRAASAGRTLRVNVDPNEGYSFPIAGIGYADVHTVFGPDIPVWASSFTTPDGLLSINAFSDTPGTTPASFSQTVNGALEWLGIAGGTTSQGIDGTESLSMQFAGTAGLTGLGARYIGGTMTISGFIADPGLVGPTGAPITGSTYADGTLTFAVSNSWHAAETVMRFTNPAASAGRTLSLHTDGDPNAQIPLVQIDYAEIQTRATISIARYGNNVVLTWPTGTLQQATDPSNLYSDVVGATSPYTNSISGPQKFFRVKVSQ